MIGPFGDDKVVDTWTFHGRHTGELIGAPPSGVEVAFDGVDICTMRGAEILEQHHVVDVASPIAQIAR